MRDDLLRKLSSVEKVASSSKVGRLIHNPYKYVTAIFFKNFIYPKRKKERRKVVTTFFDKRMQIDLPAATDIYLTGGKSHNSEIRLAKFIIRNLSEGAQFLDVGAHYGYFSLLASTIVGSSGQVHAFEPASKSYALLRENSIQEDNIFIHNKAISNDVGTLVFYEFPNLYSEYNTMNIEQFENQSWFSEFKPVKVEIPATTIDLITKNGSFLPSLIKIDVEGAEYNVVLGARCFLENYSPLLVMEYLKPNRQNEEHQKAVKLLTEELGYSAHIILDSGHIKPIENIDSYLINEQLESDNIVFRKS